MWIASRTGTKKYTHFLIKKICNEIDIDCRFLCVLLCVHIRIYLLLAHHYYTIEKLERYRYNNYTSSIILLNVNYAMQYRLQIF